MLTLEGVSPAAQGFEKKVPSRNPDTHCIKTAVQLCLGTPCLLQSGFECTGCTNCNYRRRKQGGNSSRVFPSANKALGNSTLIILFEVFHLFHCFTKYLPAILRRIPILYQANLDIKFQLIQDDLVVQPVITRRFCINDFFDPYASSTF